nr:hypothetical protein [Primorskyibacter marinus]
MPIQTRISQTVIAAFHECVLHWLAGGDAVPADTSPALTSGGTQRHDRAERLCLARISFTPSTPPDGSRIAKHA